MQNKPKAYKVITSAKVTIRIDEDEVQGLFSAIQTGNPFLARDGLINPSHIVAVVEDKERVQNWIEDTRFDEEKRLKGLPILRSIFNDINKQKVKELAGRDARIETHGPEKPLGTVNFKNRVDYKLYKKEA